MATTRINALIDNNNFPFGLDLDWHNAEDLQPQDAYLRNWLLDTGSLTERLQSMCREFSLQRLGQATQPLHSAEQAWLGSASDDDWEVREVLLIGDGCPWVFARSVIPKALTRGELADLGGRPLGKQLFNDPRFVRGDFQLAQVTAQRTTIPLITNAAQTLWARRSRFSFAGVKMIVAEAFLPGSPAYASKGI